MNEARLQEKSKDPEAGAFEKLDVPTFKTALDRMNVQVTDKPLTDQEIEMALEQINATALEQQTSPLGIMYNWIENLKRKQFESTHA